MIDKLNIKLTNITKAYDTPVLTNINLEINNRSYITIVGKSGSGKSTMMNILGLIEGFDSGSYMFNNINIKKDKDYSKIRSNNIGFIYQSYNLISTMSSIENIMLPLQYSKKMVSDIDEIIKALDLTPLLKKPVTVLSGGEKQRVAIARSLVLNPSIIIADEPTGNLDSYNTDIVLDILKKENQKGRAVVMITHSEKIASNAKEVYKLQKGELIG